MNDPRPVPPAELERRVAAAVPVTDVVITDRGAVLFTGRAQFALTDTSVIVPAETVLALAASIAADSLEQLRALSAQLAERKG